MEKQVVGWVSVEFFLFYSLGRVDENMEFQER